MRGLPIPDPVGHASSRRFRKDFPDLRKVVPETLGESTYLLPAGKCQVVCFNQHSAAAIEAEVTAVPAEIVVPAEVVVPAEET